MGLHSQQTLAKGVHGVIKWTYANAAARTAATGFTAVDLYGMALDLDTLQQWLLTSHSPIVWTDIGNAAVGQNLNKVEIPCVKATAGTISVGQVVRQTGWDVSNTRAEVELAQSTPTGTLFSVGICSVEATDSTPGKFMIVGTISGIDTSGKVAAPAYLSTTAGEFTNTAPAGPNLVQPVGVIANVDASDGVIGVNILSFRPIDYSSTPQPLGTAAAGTNNVASPSDHVHALPTLDDLTFSARKGSGGTIARGNPVYISGYNVGGWIEVEEAQADSSLTMPAVGVANSNLTNAADGTVLKTGFMDALNTSSWSVGDELWVSDTAAGEFVNVKPDNTALIQKIAQVTRSDASNGSILVFGAGRVNDLPNLQDGYIWQGDSNGVPVAVEFDPATYAQIVTVAKSGGQYTSIQSAIDSITDASTSKRYVVIVYPGDYSENVTMKDWVDVIGQDSHDCRITVTSGTGVTFGGTGESKLIRMAVIATYGTMTANSTAVAVTGGSHQMFNCFIQVSSTGGEFVCKGVDHTGGSIELILTRIEYTRSGGVGSLSQIAMTSNFPGLVAANSSLIVTQLGGTDKLYAAQFTGSVDNLLFANNQVVVTSVSGEATGVYVSAGTLAFTQNSITVSAAGDAYGGFLTGTCTINTQHNSIAVTSSGGNAYSASIGAGCFWNAFLDIAVAAQGYTGVGTVAGVINAGPGILLLGSITDGVNSLTPAQGATAFAHTSLTDNPHTVTPDQVGNTTAQWNADQLQGRDVDAAAPSDGQVLKWDSGDSDWEPRNTIEWQQIRIVAKSGGQYSTIQSAIDSITDASTSKRYAVLVYPGYYSESVTMKDYVTVVGTSSSECFISVTSGTALTFNGGLFANSNIINMGILGTYGTLTQNESLVKLQGSGIYSFVNCFVEATSTGGNFTLSAIEHTGGLVNYRLGLINYRRAGGTGTLAQRVIGTDFSGFSISYTRIDSKQTSGNDELYGIWLDTNAADTVIADNQFLVTNESGDAYGVYVAVDGIEFRRNAFDVTASATAYGVEIVGTSITVKSVLDQYEIIGTTNAYLANISSTCVFDAIVGHVEAADGVTGAGTLNATYADDEGNLTVTGDLTDGTVSHSVAQLRDATKLQGRDLAATAPADGQVISWNSGGSTWQPSSIVTSGLNYKGSWNANTNTPTLGDSGAGGVQGDYYVVSVAGSTSVDGETDWKVKDWITHNGSVWQKIDNTESVVSVAGKTGAVALDHTTDLANVGTNSHATIDSHIASTSNPHSVTAAQTGAAAVTSTAPVNVTKAAAQVGVSAEAARQDHKHDVDTAAPGATGVATASGEGSATTLARSDHTHQANSAPVNVTKAAAAIGTSGQPARADHKHDITTAAAVAVGTANAEGNATSLARSNHTHQVTGLTISGQAQGDILYRNASAWVRLAAGTSGDFLKTNGAAANPEWASVGSSPGAGIKVFGGNDFAFPLNSDWGVNAFAALAADSNNAGLIVRRFDDATNEGVGFKLDIPTGVTTLNLRIKSRAETAPGSSQTVRLLLYNRELPDNGAVEGWTSDALTNISIPNNENWQYDTDTITLTTLGATAGNVIQFELVRNATDAGDTLSGDWTLLQLEAFWS